MAKIEYSFIKSEFEKRGWVLKSKEYKNNASNLDAICASGHDTTITWANFKKGQGCRFCSGTIKYSYDKVKKDFEEAGCKLLETEYKRNITPMSYICSCGNEDKISYYAMMQGARCKKCTAKKISDSLSIKDDVIKSRFEQKGLKFISKTYENERCRVQYECKCGEIAFMNLDNLNKQDNCRKCGSAKISKEKCYMWKKDRSKVTFNKVFRKRLSNLITRFFDNNFRKHNKSESILRYSPSDFKNHINNLLAKKGITRRDEFHVDHIIPVDAFLQHEIYDLSLINDLSNLNVLTPEENIKKANKYEESDFLNYVQSKSKKYTIENWLTDIGLKYTLMDDCYNVNNKKVVVFDVMKTNKKTTQVVSLKRKYGDDCIVIFSDEWESRREQVVNLLKSKLGLIKNKFMARKCKIKKIEPSVGREFCNKHHIQGGSNHSKAMFGIFNEEILLGVLSLGKHPRNEKELTLDRLCFLQDCVVAGGANRLFKLAIEWAKENGYKEISSFSDNRISQGNIYNVLGFSKVSTLSPDYSYSSKFHPHLRVSKQSMKKSSSGCPTHLTENEWAEKQGLSKVYDCGKIKWSITI